MRQRLFETLVAVNPKVVGVALEKDAAPTTARVDVSQELTPQERIDIDAALAAFDPAEESDVAWRENKKPERKALREAAQESLAANNRYLALATPTQAEMRHQLDRLTRQMNHVIRRLVQLD